MDIRLGLDVNVQSVVAMLVNSSHEIVNDSIGFLDQLPD
eukprot:SAG22_NODE_872_length_6726_cov_2.255923_1_plen_39_part_00